MEEKTKLKSTKEWFADTIEIKDKDGNTFTVDYKGDCLENCNEYKQQLREYYQSKKQ